MTISGHGVNTWDHRTLWLPSGVRGMFVIALADLWKTILLVVLILLAGLESILGNVYEAADVDTAGGWQEYWHMTISLLMPLITMALPVAPCPPPRVTL